METSKIMLNSLPISSSTANPSSTRVSDHSIIINPSISSIEEFPELSLHDDSNIHNQSSLSQIRNSETGDDRSQRSSYDFLNPSKPSNMNPSKVVRCISPLPLHKTLNSEGNIIFEPVNPEDSHSFGPCEEEISKVDDYLESKKKNKPNSEFSNEDKSSNSKPKLFPMISPEKDLIFESFPETPKLGPRESQKLYLSQGEILSNSNPITPLSLINNLEQSSNRRTLEATSHELLDEESRICIKRLSVSILPLPNEDSEPICVVQCKKLIENEITYMSDLVFTCGSPQLRKDGFFAKKFIEYQISVPQLGWSVKRRYNDFKWLRDALIICNPASYIPPLPPKKASGSFGENFIKKRQIMLNKFISSILRDPELRSANETLVFLKENNETQLIKYQRGRMNLKRIERFDEVFTLEGETFCDLSEKKEVFECTSDFLDISCVLEEKIKDLSKVLIDKTKKLSQSIQDMSGMIGELVEIQDLVSGGFNYSKCLENFQNSLTRWSSHEEINANNLETDIKFFYSYKLKEKKIVRDLVQEQVNRRKCFLKWKDKKDLQDSKNEKYLFGHFNYKIILWLGCVVVY